MDFRMFSFGLAVVTGFAAVAGTFHVKSSLSGAINWTLGSNYDEEVAPTGAGDTIQFPSGAPYVRVAVSDTDAASLALLSSVDLINLPWGTRLTIDCSGNVTFPTSVTGNGTLVKDGEGALQLASHTIQGTIYYDYYTCFDVQKGTLRLPMADDATRRTHACLAMNVAEGATLVTVSNGTTSVTTLSGGGTITNEESGVGADGKPLYPQLKVSRAGTASEFSGKIVGPINVVVQNHTFTLSGEDNTFLGGVTVGGYATTAPTGGVVCVKKFGSSAQVSSIGTGTRQMISTTTGGGLVRYIGDEDAALDRNVSITDSPFCFDAGHHGGLTFSGQWTPSSTTLTLNKVYLTGSNTVPCTITGPIRAIKYQDYYRSQYVTKQGTGTWCIRDRLKAGLVGSISDGYAPRGVFAVEEGALDFDTIAEAGVYCALGYSTDLYRREVNLPTDVDAAVGYAFMLGGTNVIDGVEQGEARFVYSGNASALVTTRPIALLDDAALVVTNAAMLKWRGVTAVGSGARTIAFETGAGCAGELYDIVDSAAAPISLEKRGLGSWKVGGTNILHGTISVKGGSLTIEASPAAGTPYKWFKLIVKETAATCPRYTLNTSQRYVAIGEIGLFDEDGIRQAISFSNAPSEAEITPGTAQLGATNMIEALYKDSSASCYFDNAKQSPGGNWGDFASVYMKKQVSLSDETTWWPAAVLCLTNGTPEIKSWDIVHTGLNDKQVTAARIMGSADGIHWERAGDADAIATNNWKWVSDGGNWSAGSTAVRKLSDGKGFALTRTVSAFDAPALTDVAGISVASGAVLRFVGVRPVVSSLTVDASGAGTVSNIAFAVDGRIAIENCPASGETVIPMAFEDVTGSGNISQWGVSINGADTAKRRAYVSFDGIHVVPSGFVFTVR